MEIDNKLLLENSRDLSILYVEDDASLRETTIGLLENFFKSVDAAEDGEIAYEKYKRKLENESKAYDIIISDINMPNMNGIKMSKEIKGINPDQAIIFITAFHEMDLLKESISLGINGFIIKPIEIGELKKVLYRVSQMVSDRKIVFNHYQQIEDLNMLNIDKKDTRGYKSSKDILEDLENHQEMISQLWVEKEVVVQRLESHLIDIEFFRNHYAMKVIDYFLGVIRGDNEIGNCPVIFIMLDFFKNKNLPLKDIFMICVSFKNTVSAYVFEKYNFNHRLYDDISDILDQNFEGVIINYLEIMYTKKPNKVETASKDEVLNKKNEKPKELLDDINYREYVLEHDVYELQDLEEDIDTLAIAVTENTNTKLDDFVLLGDNIKKYGTILSNYPVFSELGKYIVKLGINISLNATLLFDDKERVLNIAALIEGFVNDLIIWRREIFDNNIEDPHFLDQSFFSNVDTIIMFIEYDESKEDVLEDDFDDMFF